MRIAASIAGLALLSVIAVGCATVDDTEVSDSSNHAVERSSGSDAALRYFAKQSLGEAAYVASPESIDKAAELADVVVEARISEVVPTRVDNDKEEQDGAFYFAWVLDDVEILNGSIDSDLKGKPLQVEFIGAFGQTKPPGLLQSLREGVPEDKQIWFLDRAGRVSKWAKSRGLTEDKLGFTAGPNQPYYHLMHPETLVVDSPSGATTPLVPPDSRMAFGKDVQSEKTLPAVAKAANG